MIRILLFLFVAVPALTLSVFAETFGVERDLQLAINLAADGDTLVLGPRRYVADPRAYNETLCGNCQNHQTPVKATRGFVIDGKHLFLRGDKHGKTILETRAGYGLLILNSAGCVLENLVITGGKRDADGQATDGGIVVKGSTVTIRRCAVLDNTHFIDSTVVGIAGIALREGADARIQNCQIVNNSWDGIALYRGATAHITECAIDSGRGAGIGVTWDAVAVCERNRISHYWKGIGAFGTATVVARANAVFDNLGWGIIAAGSSTLIAENNVSARNGNCGIAIWNKGTRGRLVNNISADNGWKKEWVCPCVGFWNQEGDTAGWTISHNLLWDNAAGNVRGQDSTGFIIADPQFADSLWFHLKDGSPARQAGDGELTNPDGTRSDIGLSGGAAGGK
jgi:parallel beta-helix repeat protein